MRIFRIGALLALALGMTVPLSAQTVPFTFSGTSPVSFKMDSYGNLSSIGTFGTGTFSLTGAGTRMFWYPGKASFRAGYVDGTQWDDANIGTYSTAFGYNSIASGPYSLTTGYGGTASGSGAVSMGNSNVASGANATAMGGSNTASGPNSTSMGGSNTASGTDSTAMGGFNAASGSFSSALGYGNLASGPYSFSSGYLTVASGTYASAFGNQTTAAAFEAFVVGQYNVGGGNSTTWVATDPIFEIGNGTSPTALSDALVVYKNGNVTVQGSMRCSPGGDLPMGSFTAGTHP